MQKYVIYQYYESLAGIKCGKGRLCLLFIIILQVWLNITHTLYNSIHYNSRILYNIHHFDMHRMGKKGKGVP